MKPLILSLLLFPSALTAQTKVTGNEISTTTNITFGGNVTFNIPATSSMTWTCPTGFVAVVKYGHQSLCIQISTNGVATTWNQATYNCFTSYGGSLPNIGDLYIGRVGGFGVLYGSTEWTSGGTATIGVDNYGVTLTATHVPSVTTYGGNVLYRCAIYQ